MLISNRNNFNSYLLIAVNRPRVGHFMGQESIVWHTVFAYLEQTKRDTERNFSFCTILKIRDFVTFINLLKMTRDGRMIFSSLCGPPIEFGEIYTYLIDTPGQFTREQLKLYKSLEAFNYYKVKYEVTETPSTGSMFYPQWLGSCHIVP